MTISEWLGVLTMAGVFMAWMTGTFWKLGAIAQNTKMLRAKTDSIETKLDQHSRDINGLRVDVVHLEDSVVHLEDSVRLSHNAHREQPPDSPAAA